MSSIVKWQFIENNEDEHVLDANSRIREHFEAYQREQKKQRDRVNKAAIDDFFAAITTDEEGNTILPMDESGRVLFPVDEDGNQLVVIDEEGNLVTVEPDGTEGGDDDMSPEPVADMRAVEEAQEQADAIIADAQAQADEILAAAQVEAEAMKSHYAEEGKKEGYRDGTGQAMQEYAEKEAAIEAEKEQLAAAYRAKEEQMERIITDGVCDLMERFFQVRFGDDKELLYHLVDNCVLHIESSHQFLIKVGEEGFAALNEKKEELQEAVGADAVLDIVRDPVLAEGQCIIETDGGVFDCSLDTELRNLIRDIKALNI